MNSYKLKTGIVIFVIGLIGILSILTMELPIPADVEKVLSERFTPQQIKLLTLINPTILLLIATILGTLLYDKVKLKVSGIESFFIKNDEKINFPNIIKTGILWGVISGIAISAISLIFNPFLPKEFLELGENIKPSLAGRFLYGGFTEEILLRFGVMTLIVWITTKFTKGISSVNYWIGILLAAIIFALGHFPVAFQAVGNPSGLLLSYILLGNTVGGVIFGWLYWKKGLEAAFIGHIFTHVVMVIAESF